MNTSSLTPIAKDFVLNLFQEQENHREEFDRRDNFANDRIADLRRNNEVTFYQGLLNTGILEKIILPHHIDGQLLIPDTGLPIAQAYEVYFKVAKDVRRNQITDICTDKITNIAQKILFNEFAGPIINFLLLSDNAELVHPGHYKGWSDEHLFIANGFHRWIARYSLLVERNYFMPIPYYFVTDKQMKP